MATKKFGNLDRNRVIRAVEEYYDVKLEKVRRRPKWLQDESGRNWWVLGGYGDYHGVPEDMMEAELQALIAGILIIAERKLPDIEIFSGSVEKLCKNRNRPYRAGKTTGDYQFNIHTSGSRLMVTGVKTVPIVRLERIDSFSYSEEDKAQDRKLGKLKDMLNKLSDVERKEVVARIMANAHL